MTPSTLSLLQLLCPCSYCGFGVQRHSAVDPVGEVVWAVADILTRNREVLIREFLIVAPAAEPLLIDLAERAVDAHGNADLRVEDDLDSGGRSLAVRRPVGEDAVVAHAPILEHHVALLDPSRVAADAGGERLDESHQRRISTN